MVPSGPPLMALLYPRHSAVVEAGLPTSAHTKVGLHDTPEAYWSLNALVEIGKVTLEPRSDIRNLID